MMERGRSQPYLLDLSFRGFIEGLTYLSSTSTSTPDSEPLCHFFGGLPYALPPIGPFRFQKPRPLPACYRYGTRANPGRFSGATGLCPQPDDDLNPDKWDEDCLQCNIWMPIGKAPESGWPVLFWIHGGFLQFGSANSHDLRAMLNETRCKTIVVEPAYRLNLFGFLASPELLHACPDFDVNLGFWDQRMALEWTWQNISYFGGNSSNITIGGYSAGSHSAFHQLAYDVGVPDDKSIVKRTLMLSNGPGMQPKSLHDAQEQFNELLQTLDIPTSLSPKDKLAKLRETAPISLIEASIAMKHHQFRAVTDSRFVRPGLLNEIDTGVFAHQMKRRGIKLVIGECKDEHLIYSEWRPPNDYNSLFERMQADYPMVACEVIMNYYYPDKQIPANCKDWKEAWGRVYADIQIHHLERGMINALVRHGAGDLVYRYRMEWRAQCCDKKFPTWMGVTHGTDMALWFWGNGDHISKREKKLIKDTFHDNLASFLHGEEMDWGTTHPLQIRTLKTNGTIEIEEDQFWEEGLKVWELLKSVGETGLPSRPKL